MLGQLAGTGQLGAVDLVAADHASRARENEEHVHCRSCHFLSSRVGNAARRSKQIKNRTTAHIYV